MCVIGDCPLPVTHALVDTGAYGLSPQAICDQHFAALRAQMQAGFPALDAHYLADFVMLKVLMLDRPAVEAKLALFNDSMQQIDPVPMGAHNKGPRLSRVLAEFEKRCYFPDYRILPLGIIQNGFDNLGRSGFLPMKDFGAGVGHGKYTHRMQWHVVMRCVTRHFTAPIAAPWRKSPLDLFIKSMSTTGSVGTNGVLAHPSTTLFGFLCDQQAVARAHYSHPDHLFDEMRRTDRYPVLGRSASKSWEKRLDADGAFTAARAAQVVRDKAAFAIHGAQQEEAQSTIALQQARAARDRHAFGISRWIANAKVGTAKQAAQRATAAHQLAQATHGAAAAAVAPPAVAPADATRQKHLARGWQPMGAIPDADPYGQRGAAPDIDYADAILVPPGAVAPSAVTIQANLTHSATQFDPTVVLPNLPGRGHP